MKWMRLAVPGVLVVSAFAIFVMKIPELADGPLNSWNDWAKLAGVILTFLALLSGIVVYSTDVEISRRGAAKLQEATTKAAEANERAAAAQQGAAESNVIAEQLRVKAASLEKGLEATKRISAMSAQIVLDIQNPYNTKDLDTTYPVKNFGERRDEGTPNARLFFSASNGGFMLVGDDLQIREHNRWSAEIRVIVSPTLPGEYMAMKADETIGSIRGVILKLSWLDIRTGQDVKVAKVKRGKITITANGLSQEFKVPEMELTNTLNISEALEALPAK